ncbi:MAG: CBS domain-containing protein [Myxococcota bacterium]
MSLERFCRKRVVTVSPTQSVSEAARKMREEHVGLVVVEEGGKPVGILTDRDVTCRVVAEGREAKALPVGEVMSRDVVVAQRDSLLDEVVVAMRRRGVRRIPIVDADGKVAGLVSLDDLTVLFAAELHQLAAAVRENQGP